MYAFHAMGTEVTVAAPTCAPAEKAELAARIARLFAEREARFSRFRADSELARLNRATGPVSVSRELFAALVAARRHVDETGGLFEPAVGGALRALGYDRPFAPGALDRDAPGVAPPARFAEVTLDETARVVARPAHVEIDLGGLVKGRTVDEAAALLPVPGAIDAGGDLAVRADGAPWMVDVEDPADAGRTLLTLAVAGGAVATSAPNRRSWRVGDGRAHHLVDPRTGRPADSDLAQVTVLAPGAERAEVLAKAVFLLGAAAGRAFLEARAGCGGVLVRSGGDVELVGAVEVARA